MHGPLAGSDAGRTLAGAPTWPLWPGGVRYVQSESLKAIRLFLAGVQLPAAGLPPATALNSHLESHHHESTPRIPSGVSAGALYVKTPITPEEIFRAIARLRKEARDEIDRLIRFLDNHMELGRRRRRRGGRARGAFPRLVRLDEQSSHGTAVRQPMGLPRTRCRC
jgi:hypothetical protein